MSCVLLNDSHRRLEKNPQHKHEQSQPRVPALPAQIVKCLRHPFAEPFTERPRIQPQQHRIPSPIALDTNGHAPTVLSPPPPHRDTASALLPAPPAPPP